MINSSGLLSVPKIKAIALYYTPQGTILVWNINMFQREGVHSVKDTKKFWREKQICCESTDYRCCGVPSPQVSKMSVKWLV